LQYGESQSGTRDAYLPTQFVGFSSGSLDSAVARAITSVGALAINCVNVPAVNNSIAWKAAKARQPLPSGSIILSVSYEAQKDAAGKEIAGAIQSYSAMESRSGWGNTVPLLLRNGDWDYALFSADGKRRDQLNQAPCLACHKPQEANSYVFTLELLRKAAS
jgi:hypothetical protein